MKKMVLSKLVLREYIEAADRVSKKAQKWILGGYGEGCDVECWCHSGGNGFCPAPDADIDAEAVKHCGTSGNYTCYF